MAYINQYQVDQQNYAREQDTLNRLGAGLEKYFTLDADNRRRALETQRQKDTLGFELAKMGASPEDIKTYQDGGGAQNIFSKFSEKAEAARLKALADAELDNMVKKSQIAKNLRTSSAPTTAKLDPVAVHAAKLKLTNENEKQKSLNSGELEVPGFGMVRTPEEAKTIRTAKGDAETAKEYIRQIKELGKDVAVWDRSRIGKIDQLKQALVGKLRLPLMGPGTMTEDEFQRTVSNLGDPGALFGTEANEMGKLDQMSQILDSNIKAMYSAAARDGQQPLSQSVASQQAPAPQAPVVNVPPQVQQRLQAMTPEQKLQHLNNLRAKKSQAAMVGR